MNSIPHDAISSVQKSYIICSTGRSGSSLLSKTLSKPQNCGNPEEYFHPNELTPRLTSSYENAFTNYYLAVIQQGTSPNGIFGLKIHWHHFKEFLKIARQQMPTLADATDIEIIQQLFPNPKFIHIARQDTLQQAVSTCVAHQTKIWSKSQRTHSQTPLHRPRFAPLDIYRYKVGIEAHNRAWERFFAKHAIQSHKIVYEELVNAYADTIRGIYEFLEISLENEPVAMPIQKQANELNERWVTYYQCIPEGALAVYSNTRVKLRQWLEKQRAHLAQ